MPDEVFYSLISCSSSSLSLTHLCPPTISSPLLLSLSQSVSDNAAHKRSNVPLIVVKPNANDENSINGGAHKASKTVLATPVSRMGPPVKHTHAPASTPLRLAAPASSGAEAASKPSCTPSRPVLAQVDPEMSKVRWCVVLDIGFHVAGVHQVLMCTAHAPCCVAV